MPMNASSPVDPQPAPWRPRLLQALLLCLWCLPVALPAQERAKADRLQQLLQELGTIEDQTWAERLQSLQQAAAAAKSRAATLEQEALQRKAAAQAALAEAEAIEQEAGRLRELQRLLQAGSKPVAVEATAKAPMPAAAAAEAKPAEPKPPAKEGAKKPAAESPKPAPKAEPPAIENLVLYNDVEPIFAEHCAHCHEPGDTKGGLDVTTLAALRTGGSSGRSLVPGEPDQSRLWRMVAQQERPFMPRGEAPLGAEPMRLLKRWIELGLPADRAEATAFQQKKAASAAQTAAAETWRDDGPLPARASSRPLQQPPRAQPLKSLARSRAANLLAMPGRQQLLLLDLQGELLAALDCPGEHIETLAFGERGEWLVAAAGTPARRGEAVLYEVATGKLLGRFGRERDVPLAVAAHRGKGLVALGGAGKRTVLHRVDDGQQAWLMTHEDFVLAMQFSPDGEWLATADRSGQIALRATADGALEHEFRGHRGAVPAIAFAAGGRQLWSVGADGTLRAFDVQSGRQLWQQSAHDGEVLALAIGPQGRAATGGSDGRIKLWAADGKPVVTSPAVGEWVYALAFADADTVLGGDWQGRLHRFASKAKAKELPFVVPLPPAVASVAKLGEQ